MPPPYPETRRHARLAHRPPHCRRPRPGRRLGKGRGRPPEEHQAGDLRLRPPAKAILARRQEDHLPGRGEGHRQPVLPDLRHGPGDAASCRRVSPGVGKTTCALLPPGRQEDHLRQQPPRPGREEALRRRVQAARGGHARPSKRRRYSWDFDPHMEIFEANLDGTGLKRLTDAQGLRRRGQLLARRQADRLLLQPLRREEPRAVHHGRRRQERPAADQRARAATTAARSSRPTASGHLPQRPQEEGPAAALRHQRRRHRREGADRRRQLGLLGPVLVQGRQAHHLHRAPTTPTRRRGRTTTCTG